MVNSNLHSERELLSQLAKGSEAAFTVLYKRHWNRIYSTALAFTQSHHIAMDIVQDTFAMIWKTRQKLADVDNIEAYIYVTGRNRIASVLRTKRVYLDADLLSSRSPEDDKLSPERQAALKQFQDTIQKAIRLLPPQQAAVFTLSRMEERSYEEIAEELSISKDTVRNHMIKALSFMRAHFASRHQDLLFFAVMCHFT